MRIASNKKKFTLFFILSIIIFIIIVSLNFNKIKKDTKDYLLKNFEILLIQDSRFVENNIMYGENKFNYFKRVLKNFPIYLKKQNNFSTLKIDLNFKYLLKMRKEIINAEKIDYLHLPKYYPVKIKYNGKNYEGKIRLKGILPSDHYRGNIRWSFKVDLKKNQYIDGLNEFVIQKPLARQFPYDHLFHEWIRPKNILTSTHGYKKVIFNGEKWGIMNFEASYTSQFVESSEKKFAPIISHGNTYHWYLKKINNQNFNEFIDNSKIGRSEIEIHNKKKVLRDEQLFSLSKQLVKVLKNNEINEKNVHEFFDMEKFGHLITASLIWQTFHSLSFENLKLYINPYTLKIEPVVSDQSVINKYGTNKKLNIFSGKEPNKFITYIIHSSHFKNNFKKYLTELENNLSHIYDEEKKICGYFLLDCPKINKKILLTNLRKIKNNSHGELFKDIKIYKEEDKKFKEEININKLSLNEVDIFNIFSDKNEILIENLLNNRVEIKYLKFRGGVVQRNLILDPFKIFKLKINDQTKINNEDEVEIIFKIGKRFYTQKSKNLNPYSNNYFILSKNNNYKNYFEKEGNFLKLKKNAIIIKEKIIIPESFKILINSGQKIFFADNSFLVSFSPIIAKGTKDNKIIISSLKKEKNFSGIYILNSSEQSVFENVTFENLGQLTYKNLNLSGCINFYDTKIKIKNIQINNSNCEDLINFINSKYKISDSNFLNSKSDGIDSDFSEGIIINSVFENIGGDAIDLSGSNLYVKNLSLKKIKDKAFSIGEKSKAEINDVLITDTGVGLAAKDGSDVKIFNSKISLTKLYDIMAYEKKNFYGSSKIYAYRNDLDPNKVIASKNNFISLDEKNVLTTFIDVKKLYSEEIMKK